ncbi:malto-oligosyltrehalose trehalohydrolase [Acidiferrimicrobium sp. IK]|uniref:malto-oligosyltrehalose trehalohydrolase n=1 Tax=Acidiferrimicrobium sp. IK TaxID=2871700 RepID=UPI0021CB30FD|nr:malto-oligosyltrehalose trehalohydrolase [Acidiferrimicrobium sp. IK]MCU4184554.1 malto-oligosyltrehalose trehalohydrolase [Acidiferrimicrobium sp. IK]
MTEFAVWAPGHHRVELVSDGRSSPMSEDPTGGWWRLDVPAAGPGTRYGFSVDGGPARPDPCSPWQPDGVDGLSATVDHAAFEWSDRAWRGTHWPSTVLYELHIGTFTSEGTFDTAIERLDHLVELGVTAVELLPVAEANGGRGWGYDGVDLWAPHHAYGGPDGLKRFVDAAHSRGLAVVLDVVYNHLGPSGNYLSEFGPYFTDRYSTPWGSAINVDGAGSDEVRRFIIANACMWFADYHVDGLRLDAVHAIVDESALHVLEEMAEEVEALAAHLGRPLWLIAESDRNDPSLVRSREAGGYGLTASWSDDFHHALHAALSGDRSGYYEDYGLLSQVGRALERVYVYGRDYSPHRDRHHGRPAGDLPRTSFLGYLQNHDQIGNRAVGDRSAALLSAGRLKVGAALVLTAPFVPMLFQGEEWGASTPWQYFTDHPDPELGRAVREGRRKEFAAFGWAPEDVPDPQDPATRDRSVLRWEELDTDPHRSVLEWHRTLLALRRELPALATDGPLDTAVEVSDDEQWLQVSRAGVQISANLGAEPRRFPVGGAGRLLAASSERVVLGEGWVEVPADAAALTA